MAFYRTSRHDREAGGGPLLGEARRFCRSVERQAAATRVRRAITAASAPGPERREALGEARAAFFEALAMLLRDLRPGDDLADAAADFCAAEARAYPWH